MSKSRRLNSSGELDVFEAALYYSGEVHEANLIGIRRAAAAAAAVAVVERRSVNNTPGGETTELFRRLAKSGCQPSKEKGERQVPCPGAKLGGLFRSFFDLVIPKKKATPLLSQRVALRDCEEKKIRCMVNARAAPVPGKALIVNGRSKKDGGGGRNSSSDLVELENYSMGGVCNSKSYLFMRPTRK